MNYLGSVYSPEYIKQQEHSISIQSSFFLNKNSFYYLIQFPKAPDKSTKQRSLQHGYNMATLPTRNQVLSWIQNGVPDPRVGQVTARAQEERYATNWILESKEKNEWETVGNSVLWVHSASKYPIKQFENYIN